MAKRTIFIALDHDSEVIGIVISESMSIAHAFFVGRGSTPHTVREVDPNDESLGVLGLVVLFNTRTLSWSDIREIADRRRTSSNDKPLRIQDNS